MQRTPLVYEVTVRIQDSEKDYRLHERTRNASLSMTTSTVRAPPITPRARKVPRFVRFIVHQKIEGQPRHSGLFTAAYQLQRTDDLLPYERLRLEQLLQWFEAELTVPPRSAIPPGAISGTAMSAHRPNEMRELAEFCEKHGIHHRAMTGGSIGKTVYRDEHQNGGDGARTGGRADGNRGAGTIRPFLLVVGASRFAQAKARIGAIIALPLKKRDNGYRTQVHDGDVRTSPTRGTSHHGTGRGP